MSIKNLVTISLVIFIIAVVGILGASAFTKSETANQNNKQLGDNLT